VAELGEGLVRDSGAVGVWGDGTDTAIRDARKVNESTSCWSRLRLIIMDGNFIVDSLCMHVLQWPISRRLAS
jgi:hypothetical protein